RARTSAPSPARCSTWTLSPCPPIDGSTRGWSGREGRVRGAVSRRLRPEPALPARAVAEASGRGGGGPRVLSVPGSGLRRPALPAGPAVVEDPERRRGDAPPPALGARGGARLRRGRDPPRGGAAGADLDRVAPRASRADGLRLRRRDLAAQRQLRQPRVPGPQGIREGEPRDRDVLGGLGGMPPP